MHFHPLSTKLMLWKGRQADRESCLCVFGVEKESNFVCGADLLARRWAFCRVRTQPRVRGVYICGSVRSFARGHRSVCLAQKCFAVVCVCGGGGPSVNVRDERRCRRALLSDPVLPRAALSEIAPLLLVQSTKTENSSALCAAKCKNGRDNKAQSVELMALAL